MTSSSVVRRLQLATLGREGDALRIYVSYHAQRDPEIVLEVLARLSREGL